MLSLLCAALISTLSLEGEVTADGGDYVVVPFEVPEGTVEIVYAHADGAEDDVLDFGLFDGAGFRGWGGGLEEDAVIGVTEASRGYVPGPIAPGTWYVVIGKAKIVTPPANYTVTLSFHDVESLTPRPRAEPGGAVLRDQPGWYAGDFHVHSNESGDASASFADIRARAAERGLDFVVLSDHNTTTQQALVAAFQDGVDDVLFVRGCEITTYAGHGNGVGISGYVDHRIGLDGRAIDAVLDEVRGQGGLFVVNHPALDLGDACIGCAWAHETDWSKVAGIELQTGSYDYWPVFGRPVLALWDEIHDQGHRVTGVGGSDDHRAEAEPGASTDSQIGSPTTVIYADALSEDALMAGLAAGRVVVKLRGPGDPMVELTAVGQDGAEVGLGETATGAEVTLRARVTGGDGTGLYFVVDGVAGDVVTVAGDDAVIEQRLAVPAAGGRVRAHVVDGANDVTITNHVYLAYAEPTDEGGGCGCRAASGPALLGAGALVLAALLGLGRRRRPLS